MYIFCCSTYFSSSFWYLVSTSIYASVVAFSPSSIVGGSVNELVTWICSSCGLSCSKSSLSMSNLSTFGLELGSDWGLGKSQSHSRLVSAVSFCVLVLALVQSSSDQSDSCSEGCRMFCLQNKQDSPNLLHTLTESGTFFSVSIVSMLVTVISGVLDLFVFIGLYLGLFDHLALILLGTLFLGLFCVIGRGRELESITIIPWQHPLTPLIFQMCLNLMSQGGERCHLSAPWSKYHGLCGMVLSVHENPFYCLYSQFYIYCVHW